METVRRAIFDAQLAQQTLGLLPPEYRRNEPVPKDVVAAQQLRAARQLALHYAGRRLKQILPVIQGQVAVQQAGTIVGIGAGVSGVTLQKVATGSLGAKASGKVTIWIRESIRSKNGSVRTLYQSATLLFSDQLSLGDSGYRINREWMTNLPNTVPDHNPRLPYGDLHGRCVSPRVRRPSCGPTITPSSRDWRERGRRVSFRDCARSPSMTESRLPGTMSILCASCA